MLGLSCSVIDIRVLFSVIERHSGSCSLLFTRGLAIQYGIYTVWHCIYF